MNGQRWRYDARTMATNPHLVPEFAEPPPLPDDGEDGD